MRVRPRRPKPPSVTVLAKFEDPFADKDLLLQRLQLERPENRCLEWKLTLPIGTSATLRTRCRTVKVAASFANTDGGFIVFGVDPSGKWRGLTEKDLSEADPASIVDAVNACVSPQIPRIGYAEIRHKGGIFTVLHVPPSPFMPHVVTKEVVDITATRHRNMLLSRGGVYCRHGAKSDLAVAEDFQRIIEKRTAFLKAELLRRVKEIDLPVLGGAKGGQTSGTVVRVTRVSDDPSAPVVRLTRNPHDAGGIFLHEELSEGLFEEINNVLGANALLAKGRDDFLLGPEVYYRVYAERQHVAGADEQFILLARTALMELYGPMLYWLLRLPADAAGGLLRELADSAKSPHVHALLRIVILLGPQSISWLWERWHAKWGRYSQPPDCYWALDRIRQQANPSGDRRARALRAFAGTLIKEDGRPSSSVGELLRAPQLAASQLSTTCMKVFSGDLALRSNCRHLDIIAYGQEIEARSTQLSAAMTREP